MRKLLVTGSLGLVGSATTQVFQEAGWEVVGIDNDMRHKLFGTPSEKISPYRPKHVAVNRRSGFYVPEPVHEEKKQTLNLDIRDEGAVSELFSENQFDAIVHAAAQPSHDWSAKNPMTDFHVNTVGTLNLLEAARHYAPHAPFVFVSTDKVYGENMHGVRLSDESLGLDFAGCRSPFGCSKAAADMYVQEYGNYYGMYTVCFRPGCITGKAHKGAELHGFLAYLVKCVKEGVTYKIFGNGKNVRDQIHAIDLALAFKAFIENPKKGAVYNIGGGPQRAISILEALDIVGERLEKPLTSYEFHEARKGDRLYDVHDVTKFKIDYPSWDYTYSLDDIINELCAA